LSRAAFAAIATGFGLVLSGSALSQTPVPPKGNVDKLINDILNDPDKRKPSTAPTQPRMAPVEPRAAPAASPENGPINVEALRQTIRPCWNTEAAKTPFIVTITVRMNRDARPLQAIPRDNATYDSDPNYRTVADAALRAIMNPRCQPWPLPLDRYEGWQTLTFNFDPRNF
jgi:hypothetical protein